MKRNEPADDDPWIADVSLVHSGIADERCNCKLQATPKLKERTPVTLARKNRAWDEVDPRFFQGHSQSVFFHHRQKAVGRRR